MRRLSLALVLLLVTLNAAPLAADSSRGRRDDRGVLDRIVRVVRGFFGLQPNSDGLMPPVPGPSGPGPSGP